MVENENLLLRYKNEEEYINDNTIAGLLQNMLNTAAGRPLFKVYLDSKDDPHADEAYSCTLKTRIEPYMLKGAHCESVYVRLTVKYPIENEQEKNKVINVITKCLGFVTGEFKCHSNSTIKGHNVGDSDEGIDYTFCSNFIKDETGTPENINSHYTASLVMKGNMHITRSDGGVLGDLVDCSIVLNDKEYSVVGRTVEGSWQANVDSPIKAGSFRPETEYNSVSNAKSLILLYRNDYICNLLRDFAQGLLSDKDNPFVDKATGKPVLTLSEKYPNSEEPITNTYYIYEVKETREAGSYMCLLVTLIKMPEIGI